MNIKYDILDSTLYYCQNSLSFSIIPIQDDKYLSKPSIDDFSKLIKNNAFTFCINITNDCNFDCDYCFNKNKDKKALSLEQAISFLEKMFIAFPGGEKYIIDLSGKGEPLLQLPKILAIAKWCQDKQNELKVEILVQFVTNGYLLTSSIADILQRNNILFGISLDGNEITHNSHRKNLGKKGTYETIVSNIEKIDNKQYIGVAATLTNKIFPLTATIKQLMTKFNTISLRPVRNKELFTKEVEEKWEHEYDLLGKELVKYIHNNDKTIFLALMNGDDFFGRYLVRAFGKNVVLNRCDAGITKFTFDVDENIYGCPALSVYKELSIKDDLNNASQQNMKKQINQCKECEFKFFCGGECEVILIQNYRPNKIMCNFKKHLILLANYLQLYCLEVNPELESELENFVYTKYRRNLKNEYIYQIMENNPNLTFTEAKAIYDLAKRNY